MLGPDLHSLRIETGVVGAQSPGFEVLALGKHSWWTAVCRGPGDAKESLWSSKEGDVCAVDLVICAKTCCVDENSRNLVCGPLPS